MKNKKEYSIYTLELFKKAAAPFLGIVSSSSNIEVARERFYHRVNRFLFDTFTEDNLFYEGGIVRVRDCVRALNSMIRQRSDRLAGFSVIQAFYDISRDIPRPDLQPGFYAEMYHLFMAIQGKGPGIAPGDIYADKNIEGREAAIVRSEGLDDLWTHVEDSMSKYLHGLDKVVIDYRKERRKKVIAQFGASAADWRDWRWHLRNIIKKPTKLYDLIPLTDAEKEALKLVEEARLPFGITPYYLSLMDDDFDGHDRAVRAQVIPTASYVNHVAANKHNPDYAFDFMLERDTSPIELITRRYPAIVILKPYNSCPQICVYCQRNWEIDSVLARGAMASKKKINQAITWIRDHPAIHDVLITGGDPFSISDKKLLWIIKEVADIKTVERIRIGTRTLVTMPMRITSQVVKSLGRLRRPMDTEISVVTHVEHPYEITPEMFKVVERLRANKISVYNQNVYTYYVSRRFEASLLRRLLKRVGIEPYYTFCTKGKEETNDYRVPIARLLQEQKEEARLLPGLARTDEAVYNVPALGKNYLRAYQHRDVISILPDGSRVYEFHPWEKNIKLQNTYIGTDVPILDYLHRLESIGEDISQYETIWYYF